jgi:glycosyltransferase involved in cell wall biosynthesis
MPKISIITTLFNYAHYIGELAQSVLRQTYRDWEWIIVDDASTDDPTWVFNQFWASNIYYIRLEVNQGYSVAKNIGIRKAQGEYFVMIDADDILMDNSLEVRLEALSKSKKLWLHAEAMNLSPSGKLEDRYIQWNNQLRRRFKQEGRDLKTWYHHRLIHAQTVMLKREFHEKLGLYDETLRFSSDNEMWRRAIRFGYFPEYISTPVSIYRAHNARMSRSPEKKRQIKKVKEYIVDVVERRYREGINVNNTTLFEKGLDYEKGHCCIDTGTGRE